MNSKIGSIGTKENTTLFTHKSQLNHREYRKQTTSRKPLTKISQFKTSKNPGSATSTSKFTTTFTYANCNHFSSFASYYTVIGITYKARNKLNI